MGLIKGVTITLYDKVQTGKDAFGAPVYTETAVTVDNVLITQPSAEAVIRDLELYGKHIEYVLCIPKGNAHVWEDRTVEFFGAKYRTVGYPMEYMEHLVPLEWNRQVKVERYG